MRNEREPFLRERLEPNARLALYQEHCKTTKRKGIFTYILTMQALTHLKIPAFVSKEGHSLLWSVETFGVTWAVVVYANSSSDGL